MSSLTLPDDWDQPGDHHTDPECPRNGDDPLGTVCVCEETVVARCGNCGQPHGVGTPHPLPPMDGNHE